MLLPPLIERELRVALRKRRPARARLVAAGVGAAICGIFLLIGLFQGRNTWSLSMHHYLFLAIIYFAVIRPAQACIGLFSEERRNQTLELLYLTGMTSGELFVGKLLGGLLVASAELLALVPFLALPFLGGGISMQLFLATLVFVPLMLLFAVSVTVLASAIARDDGAAFLLTLAIGAFICLATPIPYALGNTLTG